MVHPNLHQYDHGVPLRFSKALQYALFLRSLNGELNDHIWKSVVECPT